MMSLSLLAQQDNGAGGVLAGLAGFVIVFWVLALLATAFWLWMLIAAITNLAFYHRFSAVSAVPQGHNLGHWVITVPVAGAGIIGSRGWSGWLWPGSEGARNQFPPCWRGWQGARLAVAGVNGKAAAEPPAPVRIPLTAANTPTVAI